MKKTIRNIIILLLIIVGLGLFSYMLLYNIIFTQQHEMTQDTTIIVDDNGEIKVKEKITFTSDKDIANDVISIRRSIFAQNKYDEEFLTTKKPNSVTVELNEKILEEENYTVEKWKTKYYQTNTGIVIKNLNVEKDKVYEVNFYYEYRTIDAVEKYSNLELLRLTVSDEAENANIIIELPQETNIFEVKANVKTEYLGNNTYKINGKMKTPYTDVLIDRECIRNAQIINNEYETNNIKRTLMSENTEIIGILLMFFIITIFSFITTMVLTKKIKIEKYYERNPEEVIEPILAESIIDRKIGAKELIMSCIIELIYRGNIKNIGNDKIQLISEENITEYEYEIISLIFKREGQIISFEEIKDMFIESNEKTEEFFNRFKVIKKKIKEKLIDYNIYSKKGEMILKILRCISLVILINLIDMLVVVMSSSKNFILIDIIKTNIYIVPFVLAYVIFDIDLLKIKRKYKKLWRFDIKPKVYSVMSIIFMIILIVFNIDKHIGAIIGIVIMFILNLITFIKTKSHVFTQTGKREFERAQALKDYIVDYSLMKERELDSVIIWDEYLAYAVAFGISNKITDKFSENLMNTNIVLQKIENILKM